MRDCVIIGGKSHPELVDKICHTLDVEPALMESRIFSNGETGVNIQESVRDKNVFVIQTSRASVNDFLMELLIVVSALKIASAKSVTVVLPFFPYSRQLDARQALKKANDQVEVYGAHNGSGTAETSPNSSGTSGPGGAAPPSAGAAAQNLGSGYATAATSRESLHVPDLPASSAAGAEHAFGSRQPKLTKERSTSSPRKAMTFGEEVRTRGERGERSADAGKHASFTERNWTARRNTLLDRPSGEHSSALSSVNSSRHSSIVGFGEGGINGGGPNGNGAGNGRHHRYESDRPSSEINTGLRSWVAQSGSLIASLLATAGADHVITMDLHDPQYQGFFDVPFDNLLFRPLLIEYIQTIIPTHHAAVIVSPDAGGAKRATQVADQLHTRFALIHQDRRNNATILVGDVSDRVAILIDDLVDTGKTMMRAARLLKDHGAIKVFAVCTHGLFSGNTIYKIRDSAIDRLVTTNSIPQTRNQEIMGERMDVVDISLLFAEAIRRVYNGESISRLYNQAPLSI